MDSIKTRRIFTLSKEIKSYPNTLTHTMKNTVSREDAAYEIARAACEDACQEHGCIFAQMQEMINDYTGHLPAEVSDTDTAQALYEGTYNAAENLIQDRQKPAKNEYGKRNENGMLYWEQ